MRIQAPEHSDDPMVRLFDDAQPVNDKESLSLLVSKATYGSEQNKATYEAEIIATGESLTARLAQDLNMFLSNPAEHMDLKVAVTARHGG